jgi:uncharacterized membrane protein
MKNKEPSGLATLYNLLGKQSFYPLLLSSLLAMLIYFARVLLGHSWNYVNLVWNLVLAWVPYICSVISYLLFHKYASNWGRLLLPGLIWLIFFPNGPYMLTDFLHLETRPYIPLWYDILLLATFAWTGCFLAIVSLRTMQFLVKSYLGNIASWIFAIAVLGLSSLGVYLGRFERWNSWDLLLQPKAVVRDIYLRIINPVDNLGFVGFTLIVSAFLIVSYLTFSSINQLEEPEQTKAISGGQNRAKS